MCNCISKFVRKALKYDRSSEGSDYHLITCFALTVSIKAEKILELGVRGGNTTLAFVSAAKQAGGNVESVDINSTNFRCPRELESKWKCSQSDSIKCLGNIFQGDVYDMV